MDGNCHFLLFLLVVRFSFCHTCDCKLVDILRSIVQKEIMEREILAARVDILESKIGSDNRNGISSSGSQLDTVILQRLSAIETMIENFNTRLQETAMDHQNRAHLHSALTNAWKIHKNGFSAMKEDIQENFNNNNKSFNELTRKVENHIGAIDIEVERLINQTNKIVTKQLKHVEDRLEVYYLGLNNTFEDYTAQIKKDFTAFVNNTDHALSGIQAEIMIDDCASNPCMNGATCVDGVKRYYCVCMSGYIGTHCEIDINDCIPDPCENGGTCTDEVNSYKCTCVAGFTGSTCQTNINDCIPDPCENGGTCTDEVNSYKCTCVAGFTGSTCQTKQPIEQWVETVTAFSSQYDSLRWSANQVIGPPDVYPKYEGYKGEWIPRVLDSNQFIEVQFAEAVYITGVEVYETYYAGGVKAIKAKDGLGTWTTLWSTATVEVIRTARIFAPELSVAMNNPSRDVRIEVDSTGYFRAIDAVRLMGTK